MTKPNAEDLRLARALVHRLNLLIREPETLAAVAALVDVKVDVTQSVADHPTIQIDARRPGFPKLGIIGLLNGLCGVRNDGWGYIAGEFDDHGRLIRFVILDGAQP